MGRWLLLLAAAGVHAAHAGPVHRYEVRVGESLEGIAVTACFDGAPPEALVAADGAHTFLRKLSLPGKADTPLPASGRIGLDGLGDDACLDYRVQLRAVRDGVQTGGPESRWIGRDLLTSIGDWLWQPPAGTGDVELRFSLPPGIRVSAPWPALAGGDGTSYRLGPTPPEWPGVVALGRFATKQIEVGGARLHLSMLDGPPPESQARIEGWIRSAARNVSALTGRFPVDSLQVVVAPTPRGKGPVPWAYVARGGGPAVHFFINPAYSDTEFMRDWTATHEMSHLFLPYLVAGDAWLAEGLPTYLQNVLMARGGAIGEREAWSRMIVGFQRGAKVGAGLTLSQASGRAGIGGVYQRVYWGGAALLLEADLRLREGSRGRHSVETALEGLATCCLSQERRWSAAEVLDRLDRGTGTTAFRETADRWLLSMDFPDYQAQLVAAGVTVAGGEVQIDETAPRAALRQAIMQRRH